MNLSGKSNINPKIWGPYFWETFHFTAFGYPDSPNENDKIVYKQFYELFIKVLPCDKCSISSQDLFNEDDIDPFLESKEDLIKWTYNFHKKVNNKLNKDSPTFEEFVSNFKNRKDSYSFYNIMLIIILIILIIIGILIFTHCTSDNL